MGKMQARDKQSRIKTSGRQRQKLSRRTIIILAASGILLLTGGLTLFFNLTQVDRSTAKSTQGFTGEYMISEQVFITDKSIPEPILRTELPPGPDILQTRPIKPSVNKTQSS